MNKYEIIPPDGVVLRKNNGLQVDTFADMIVFKDEFIRWLMQQKEDKIRFQLKETNGVPTISVTHWFKPKPKPEIIERIINKEN